MYINFGQDRKALGFKISKDTECGTKLVLIINQFGPTSLLILKKPKNQIRKLYAQAMLIFTLSTTILPVAGSEFAVVYSVPNQTVTVIQNPNDQNLNSILSQLRAGFTPDTNKAGFDELPDSTNFSYDMEQGRGLKKQAKKVWRNPKAKKEILNMLERFDNEEIQEKPLEGFRKLTELKNSPSGPRVFVYRGKNENPTVVGFSMRNDLNATIKKLKTKFN